MKKIFYLLIAMLMLSLIACNDNEEPKVVETPEDTQDDFVYLTEQFADLGILRYKIPGFEDLTAKQKELAYYLYKAALSGREIIYDQNYKHNLKIKRTLEGIVKSYEGERQDKKFENFMVYTKRVWFSNGIHHHYSTKKIMPDFSKEYFAELVKNSDPEKLPLAGNESREDLINFLTPVIFNPHVASQRVNLNPDEDIISTSANNYYEGVTQKEVEDYYDKVIDKNDQTPISYGLNSKLMKEGDKIVEKQYKIGEMYTEAIEEIVKWLRKAVTVAENDIQKRTFEKLVEFYKTGDLEAWDEYNILWVQDTSSVLDAVNGFIEVYGDPMGFRGAYESVVSMKDMEATKRIKAIGDQAQWFEDNSTIMDEHKKKNVVGISAKVITVIVESGDASPSTPIGINLPNATWIRKEHGSKSVNLGNIVYSYNKAGSKKVIDEFAYNDEQKELAKNYGDLASDLHTDLHEVIGHASGQINKGVGTPKQTLKNYSSAIEETRADLVALYYIMDPKLVEIGVAPSTDVGKAEYNAYLRNGLMLQLNRVELDDNIEQAHMRNRQLISHWVLEKGKEDKIVELIKKDGKHYVVINDYEKLRELFGELLRETQRITSEGDFEAAKNLVETYGVKVDKELHKEVKERFAGLNIAPFKGFINPVLEPVMKDGKIVDVKVEYPEDFTEQMLYYSVHYDFLPVEN